MPRREIMLWYADLDNKGWFYLQMTGNVTFKTFLNDILSRKGSHGTVYIKHDDRTYSLTYSFGVVTWVSDDVLNRIDDLLVTKGQACGWHPEIDYHIEVGEMYHGN